MKKLIYLPVIALCLLLNSCAEPTQEELAIEFAKEANVEGDIVDHIKFSEYDMYQWALAEDWKRIEEEYNEIRLDETRILELYGVKEKMNKVQNLIDNELPLKGTSKSFDVYKFKNYSEVYYVVIKGKEKSTLCMKWMNDGL